MRAVPGTDWYLERMDCTNDDPLSGGWRMASSARGGCGTTASDRRGGGWGVSRATGEPTAAEVEGERLRFLDSAAASFKASQIASRSNEFGFSCPPSSVSTTANCCCSPPSSANRALRSTGMLRSPVPHRNSSACKSDGVSDPRGSPPPSNCVSPSVEAIELVKMQRSSSQCHGLIEALSSEVHSTDDEEGDEEEDRLAQNSGSVCSCGTLSAAATAKECPF